MNKEGIKFEFFATAKFFDTFELANTIPLDNFCMLVARGGDGTVHEVTNGMMYR